jgi:hypothetical protein
MVIHTVELSEGLSWKVMKASRVGRITAYDEGRFNGKEYRASGTLSGLILSHLEGVTPIGIVLDRLEECPEELGADADTHRQLLHWLRTRHPDGV